MTSHLSQGQLLEQYSQQHPDEVLLVTINQDSDIDQIMIYKGFSSSLMRPTEFNPDLPIVPKNAEIVSIDRLKSPYNPADPVYIEKELTWQAMQSYLSK
ncbi:MAG: hypothetical protein R3321_14205 [Nitrososphaeraceae archaeon]|nr:hypothetical protein [Nitrososphaeraceae archaeon]